MYLIKNDRYKNKLKVSANYVIQKYIFTTYKIIYKLV